jgi:cell wall-associated NlpC family hydrolase
MLLLPLVLAAAPTLQLQASIDGGKKSAAWAYAKAGQTVTLHAVLGGAQPDTITWFKIEPTVGSLDNTTPSFHFEPVTYAETELSACRGKVDCPADVTPTTLAPVKQLAGAGSMAFRVEVKTKDGTVISTPGMGSTKYGGLTKDVFHVAFRRDDSLIGFASELINTPYIFGSAGPDGRNQSDLLIGSDCADLIIYGRRRSGKKAEYTSSYDIDKQAPELKAGVKARVGDLVHFPSMRHVAILFEDREPVGVVDENDLIFHTCWAPPTVQRIGDTDCVAPPYRVLRFKD